MAAAIIDFQQPRYGQQDVLLPFELMRHDPRKVEADFRTRIMPS
jgi:hypothetical protein